ncbi:MAG TPA: ABC-2 transporter permease [Candidatus Dorea intestinavium]|nr:ABC-2 transporter permease [Candidatus Dorea intestinavium]
MKGLVIKDFNLIKLQKKFFIVNIAIAIAISLMNNDPVFILGYQTFVMSMFTLSTITYDESNNGNAFLFTLPISRNDYVREKYAFSLLVGSGFWLLSLVMAVIINNIKGAMPMVELLMTAFLIFPIMVILYAVMIPFQLKFGAEKGRMAIVGAVGILFITIFLLIKIITAFGVNIKNVFNNILLLKTTVLITTVILVSFVLLFISMKISVLIMINKEF